MGMREDILATMKSTSGGPGGALGVTPPVVGAFAGRTTADAGVRQDILDNMRGTSGLPAVAAPGRDALAKGRAVDAARPLAT